MTRITPSFFSGAIRVLNKWAPQTTYSFLPPFAGQRPQERMQTLEQKITQHILVQPKAHVGFGEANLPVQMAYLRAFHRTPLARVGHATCMGVVNLASFGILSTLSHDNGLPIDASLVLAGGLSFVAGRTERVSGAFAMAGFAVLFVGAHGLANAGVTTLEFSAMALGFSFLQALSHAFEDVPYPFSTNHAFESFGDWWKNSTPTQKIKYPFAALSGTFLEWWASPRLFPFLFLEGLLRQGYRPDLNETIDRIATHFSVDSRFNFIATKTRDEDGVKHYRINSR
jgi:hypothetical protein